MKKLILLILLLLISCESTTKKRIKREKVELPENEKIRILIAKSNPEIYKLVKEKFEETGKYRIISQEDQNKAFSKLKDCSTKECTFELGKVLFAKLLLTYTIDTIMDEEYTMVSYKIADVNQGVYLASSYDVIYSAGPTNNAGLIYRIYRKNIWDSGKLPNHTNLDVQKGMLDQKYTKNLSFYDTFKNPKPALNLNQEELVDELIDSLEKKLENKKNEKKFRIVFSKNGFFEELFKSEMILYDELELIDDLTIEKTLNQLKKKQQCGADECDVQLGKIFMADYLFSCQMLKNIARNIEVKPEEMKTIGDLTAIITLENIIKEVQILPKIYDMKKAKFINLDFIKFYEEYFKAPNKSEIVKKSQNLPPIFSNLELGYQYPFDSVTHISENTDGAFPRLEAIRKNRIIELVNFVMNSTLEK